MHDVNPLGLTMYLKELDRQITPKFQPIENREESERPTFAVRMIATLKRFRTIGLAWRAVEQERVSPLAARR